MFFVAYRENELFLKYLPGILEGLPIAGKFVIPQGTDLKDCKDAFIAAADAALANGATYFLTDGTCSGYHYMDLTGRRRIKGKESYQINIDFDGIFRNEIERWLGSNPTADNILWFAEQITTGRTVDKVVIVADRIKDHGFVGNTPLTMGKTEEGLQEILSKRFPDADVQIVKDLQAAMAFADEENTMLVLDRHCGIKELMLDERGYQIYTSLGNWKHASMLYMMPFETCADQLMERGTFPYRFDTEKMRAAIMRRKAQLDQY